MGRVRLRGVLLERYTAECGRDTAGDADVPSAKASLFRLVQVLEAEYERRTYARFAKAKAVSGKMGGFIHEARHGGTHADPVRFFLCR